MHYISHFQVFKESSTTAMRIIYDASAEISSKTLSLNDCLHTGPSLIQRLQNMLLTFRSHNGTDTEPEDLQYYTSSRNCFHEAGMNLRQWTSNSPALNRQARADGVYAEPMAKVLGLTWNTKTDTLSPSLAKLIKETNSTEKVSK